MSLTCFRKSNLTAATHAPAHPPCLLSIDLHNVVKHSVVARYSAFSPVWNYITNYDRCVHSCHHLCVALIHTCFVQFALTELSLWSLYICTWLGIVIDLYTSFHRYVLRYSKKVKLITWWLSAYINPLVHNAVCNACLLHAICSYILCLFFTMPVFFAIDISKCYLFHTLYSDIKILFGYLK